MLTFQINGYFNFYFVQTSPNNILKAPQLRILQFKQYLFPNKYLHMATHIDTNTWKMDWKTSYLKLI